jgi:hypothetical protein
MKIAAVQVFDLLFEGPPVLQNINLTLIVVAANDYI